ncbi:MAG: thiamine phosphate synthase [Pseudomonadota bacterium]
MPKKILAGIYGITAEKFSNGKSNIEVVREMIRGGVSVIQYREKYAHKPIREIYEECLEIREMTRKEGVMFIVNDFVDIALLVDADGVHVGQDDLPVAAVRKLVGNKLIGLSTHSPEQARAALAAGADYIGVGPIFETHTKDDVCAPVGLDYLEYAAKNVPIPFVAIGGIKEHNMDEVCRRGARCVCMVTEIVGAADIAATVRKLRDKISGA